MPKGHFHLAASSCHSLWAGHEVAVRCFVKGTSFLELLKSMWGLKSVQICYHTVLERKVQAC